MCPGCLEGFYRMYSGYTPQDILDMCRMIDIRIFIFYLNLMNIQWTLMEELYLIEVFNILKLLQIFHYN